MTGVPSADHPCQSSFLRRSVFHLILLAPARVEVSSENTRLVSPLLDQRTGDLVSSGASRIVVNLPGEAGSALVGSHVRYICDPLASPQLFADVLKLIMSTKL
jgi:hypothetical protein